MQCRFVRAGKQCTRETLPGWTMCKLHYTSGMNLKTWQRIERESKKGAA